MTAKELILKQVHDAFSGDDEMSLKASIGELTQEEASWKPNDSTWTIEEIIYHIAYWKIEYCRQGFGKWQPEVERTIGNIDRTIDLLDVAHEHLEQCLRELPDQALDKPIRSKYQGESATVCHGESAAHFFSIMLMHDISHGAQIRAIRRTYGSRTHFHPV